MKDPINRLDEQIMRMLHGETVEIRRHADTTHWGKDAEELAVAYGVKVVGRRQGDTKTGEGWGISVRRPQAAYMDALLRVAGFNVTSKPLGKKFKVLPDPWGVPAKRVGVGGAVARLLGVTPDYGALRRVRRQQMPDNRERR